MTKWKYYHRMDILSFMIVLWCVLNITWALIPDKWLLDYRSIEATTPLCVGEQQDFIGTKEVSFDMKVSGIDKVLDLDTGVHDYRWAWDGIYFKDEPVGEWQHTTTLGVGRYRWEAFVDIHVPLLLPKTVGPIESNDFEIVHCENYVHEHSH